MSAKTPLSTTTSPVSQFQFLGFSLIAAAVAAAAAFASVSFALPLWAMFVGWVAFFTRPPSLGNGATSLACIWLGVLFGMVAALLIGRLVPVMGNAAFPVVVFAVATVVVSLRAVPRANNVLSYFLGLITFFAAHEAPSLGIFVELAASSTLGAFAAWLSHQTQARLAPAQ